MRAHLHDGERGGYYMDFPSAPVPQEVTVISVDGFTELHYRQVGMDDNVIGGHQHDACYKFDRGDAVENNGVGTASESVLSKAAREGIPTPVAKDRSAG